MPAALPKVLRRPVIEFADPSTPTTRVDVSCYINRDEVTPNVENIDVGTHCNPGAQATGQITWEWTDPLSLQAALAPFVGKEVIVYERTDDDADTERTFTTEIPFNPANAGVWESGTNPNPSITYAIKSGEPTWAAYTPAGMAAASGSKTK
jgi:hypothetical protein